MIVTTDNRIEGMRVTSHLGLVRGIESTTINMWSMYVMMFPFLKFLFRSPAVSHSAAWDAAVERMTQMAEERGAQAIIGVRVDNTPLPPIHSVCTAYGTAVLIEPED